MKRIMIIGCCGAGKSTFARKLHEKNNIELFHLDQYYWKPGWEEPNEKKWIETVERISDKDQWIIDGNYGGTLDIRISKADTVVYLDYSTLTCLWRVTKRIYKYHGKNRPDMTKGCIERFDLEFYLYVAMFNFKRRKNILRKLTKVTNNKNIVVLRNDRESRFFLDNLN